MVKKLILIVALALPSVNVQGQYSLDMTVSGMSSGRIEAGLVIGDSITQTSKFCALTGLGCFYKPYVYLGIGFDLQVYPNLNVNAALFPFFSTEHRYWVDRGNNMIGDELMFGTRVQAGPQYNIPLSQFFEIQVKAGIELECPILATQNAAANFQMRGYVGLGLILHTL